MQPFPCGPPGIARSAASLPPAADATECTRMQHAAIQFQSGRHRRPPRMQPNATPCSISTLGLAADPPNMARLGATFSRFRGRQRRNGQGKEIERTEAKANDGAFRNNVERFVSERIPRACVCRAFHDDPEFHVPHFEAAVGKDGVRSTKQNSTTWNKNISFVRQVGAECNFKAVSTEAVPKGPCRRSSRRPAR
jgi:hypothetical protein